MMNLVRKLKESKKSLQSKDWIYVMPIILDFSVLFIHRYILKRNYIHKGKVIDFNIGIISSPPSISYIFKDYPHPLMDIISQDTNIFTLGLLVLFTIIMSFINGAYLALLNKDEKIKIKNFIKEGNKFWDKFFIYRLIVNIIILYGLKYNINPIILILINIIMTYIPYSIICEEGNIFFIIKKSIQVLFNNILDTIKLLVLCAGLFFIIYLPTKYIFISTTIEILFFIMLISYFGVIINKTILEIYKQSSSL